MIAGTLFLAYLFSFKWLYAKQQSLPFLEDHADNIAQQDDAELAQIETENSPTENVNLTFKSLQFVLSKVGFWIMCLVAVYFLEYGCTTVFADVFTRKM